MVDLEELDDPIEVAELRGLIEEHARATGSARAQAILADWEAALGEFVKIMPRDYKRALAELAAETAVAA
jgi:glutamate synthase domain-containing protein 3